MDGLIIKIFKFEESQIWDEFINESRWGDVLQFMEWGEVKKKEGWEPYRVAVMKGGRIILASQCLIKKTPMLGKYLYIPHGPVFHSVEDLKAGIKEWKKHLLNFSKKNNCFVIEVEPKTGYVPEDIGSSPILTENIRHLADPSIFKIFEMNGFSLTSRNMQPKYKLFYDLDMTLEELLMLMKKNTRYNVRLAERKGVVVNEYRFDNPEIDKLIHRFYSLLKETQNRAKGYPVRPLSSFITLVKEFKKTHAMSLMEAKYNNELIAMNISQRTKYWSSSFYAASNRKHTEVKAPYLLRWESIKKAKQAESRIYDFWGIIPDSTQHKGYSENKLSFGGVRIDNYGLLSLPVSKIKYQIWDKLVPLRLRILTLFRK